MSYNVDSAKYISGSLSISPANARKMLAKHKNALPEAHFLDDLDMESEDQSLPIETPRWCGEWSGQAYYESLPDILANTTGNAVIRFIWEGGDSETALRVENGKVSKAEIKSVVQ